MVTRWITTLFYFNTLLYWGLAEEKENFSRVFHFPLTVFHRAGERSAALPHIPKFFPTPCGVFYHRKGHRFGGFRGFPHIHRPYYGY